jgi:creatinine amidohydrolase/Fe(II)-dependent formamide hydrolase-like protein
MVRPPDRALGDLTFPEISEFLRATSILILPIGAIEQHGPHLPLNTDVVVAEGLTRRIIARWGDEFDLWRLPTLCIGLSREHDWAPGTLSLTVAGFAALMRDLASEIVRSLPARNLAIVNGHGGNRGVLENLIREFDSEFGLNSCVIHPFDLSKAETGTSKPDVHGGASETSVMLALAPELVRIEKTPSPGQTTDPDAVAALIFDRGTTWPWRTDDPRLAAGGVIGEAALASAERGEAIVASVVQEAGQVLRRLRENQTVPRTTLRPR